ncbi:uncharacterized protein LOC141626757 [Silene latifolia]|uniref:uncharacterized protein LOC141626757 n=1 Tax=Silene latifolia TaxID=37657 RepID=UPI003D76D790
MGRLNSIQYMDKLCNEKGGLSLPRPEELMKKSKTKRAGGYVCDEVSELLDTIKKKKDALLETCTEEEIDDDEIYIESAKGFNKKGQVWGMGKATSCYYDKPLPSSARKKSRGSSTSYTPGFVSKLSAQHQALTNELNSMKQWKLQLEQTLASQGIHITTESCNPNSEPHSGRRDDDNEGNGGNRGDFATQILGC